MIFVGDIAIPKPEISDDHSIQTIEKLFAGKVVIGNLEGSVSNTCNSYFEKKVVFNALSALPLLKKWNVRAVNLANNHVFDIPGSFPDTKKFLAHHNISSFGAGKNLAEAAQAIEIHESNQNFVLIGFGWKAIQCPQATDYKEGVNPLTFQHVKESIKKVKSIYPDHLLIVKMHWNYELEHYPQPAERQLARICIDLGVNAVIGGHSHVVQGIEMYNGSPIVYSLGNWVFPHNIFMNGKLRFPEKSQLQLAFEWNPGAEPVCHWFYYQPESHKIDFLKTEKISESETVKKLTPFRDMNYKTYCNWFVKNRNKRKLLPVFKKIRSVRLNNMKETYVQLRGILIDLILDLGMKKIKND